MIPTPGGRSLILERRGFCALLLQPPHLRVMAIPLEQLRMAAALDDAAGIHHQDLVGVHHRRQPVRDHQRGAADRDAVEFGLDRFLAFGIQRRGRLVEDQDRRILQQRARDRDALLLAAGQFQAAFADRSVVAVRAATR